MRTRDTRVLCQTELDEIPARLHVYRYSCNVGRGKGAVAYQALEHVQMQRA
jgi:hypothetical protein